MAFMMPVMKNEFDIYKGSRSRRISECSNSSTCRSRKVSECRSEGHSLSASPGNEFMTVGSPTRRSASMPGSRLYGRQFSRNSSKNSFTMSPTKSVHTVSLPKPVTTSGGSEGSLNKFHTRLVDRLRRCFRKDSSTDRS